MLGTVANDPKAFSPGKPGAIRFLDDNGGPSALHTRNALPHGGCSNEARGSGSYNLEDDAILAQ